MNESKRGWEKIFTWRLGAGILIFFLIFISLSFIIPAWGNLMAVIMGLLGGYFPQMEGAVFPERIYLFGGWPLRGDLFFAIAASGALAYFIGWNRPLLRRLMRGFSLFVIVFFFLFVSFRFLAPLAGMVPDLGAEQLPQQILLFNQVPIRGDYFLAVAIAAALAFLFVFKPSFLKRLANKFFLFWVAKLFLTIVDISLFRQLLQATNATEEAMATIPFLFAFLTNFLPFFFAVGLKTHQEGFEDERESNRVKRPSAIGRKLFKLREKSDNRMKKASRIFLWTTGLLMAATLFLITNQRFIQMNQSLHESLNRFNETAPHTILDEGELFYIYNPPLDELPFFAIFYPYWQMDPASITPRYGHYQGFITDVALLILPILLLLVTILASYFFMPASATDEWYRLLEDITDRKAKKLRKALAEMEEAQQLYEQADNTRTALRNRQRSEINRLCTLLELPELGDSNDVAVFEQACREKLRADALRAIGNTYDIQLNNLHAWVAKDLEVYKAKMAAFHEEVGVQHSVMSLDVRQLIMEYNLSVEAVKQFGTVEKTSELAERLLILGGGPK